MKLFRNTKLNAKGFSHVEGFIAVLAIVAISVIGIRVLNYSHAATIPAPQAASSITPGYVSIPGPDGSSMAIYTSDITASGLSATVEFIPASSGLTLKKAKITLKNCPDTTYTKCTNAGTSSTVINYTGNGRDVYYATTPNYSPFNGSDVYEGCATFVTSSTAFSGVNQCSGYVTYYSALTNWTAIKSSYTTSAGEPTFNGCIVKQSSVKEELKIEAVRSSSSSIVSQALVWGPNLVTSSPTGSIINSNWMIQGVGGGGVSITQATIPKADQMHISVNQTASTGYNFTAAATPPTNLGACD